MKNIVILISGEGSNMQAIVRAVQQRGSADEKTAAGGPKRGRRRGLNGGARVAAVISNRADAKGLDFARRQGIATQVLDHTAFATRDSFDEALAGAIDSHDPQGQPALVVLAGFMRILTPGFVAYYAGRLVNIHPSLLPAFAGLNTHQRAIDAGCKVSGATVHWVTAELDHGPILAQAEVPILPGDTPDTLGARVLAQEHLIYAQVIFELLQNK